MGDDALRVYVFSHVDAQRVFTNVTHILEIGAYIFESASLDEESKDLQNTVMQMHCGADGIMLYTCVIDSSHANGPNSTKHEYMHTQYEKICTAIGRALPNVRSINLIEKCGPYLEDILNMLFPIRLDETEMTQLCEATGIRRRSDEVLRNRRIEARREARRNATRRRNFFNNESIVRETGTRIVRQRLDPDSEADQQIAAARGQQQHMPPFLAHLLHLAEGMNGDDIIDQSRYPPPVPLPSAPKKETGTSLNENWESLLKPLGDLVETSETFFQCRGCCTYIRTIITMPCKHQFYCDDCFRKHMTSDTLAKTCPECREVVTGIVRAYN